MLFGIATATGESFWAQELLCEAKQPRSRRTPTLPNALAGLSELRIPERWFLADEARAGVLRLPRLFASEETDSLRMSPRREAKPNAAGLLGRAV